MKTRSKALLLALCAVLLVAASVLGTMAYLTDSKAVTNTFSVGKVGITLDEAPVDAYGVVQAGNRRDQNTYKLVPGHSYTKDPIVHVDADSENCFLFVKIENGIAAIEDADNKIVDQMAAKGWMPVNGETDVYYYKEVCGAGFNIPVFDSFKVKSDADVASYEGKTIVITAYAVQHDTFASAQAAWDATFGA